MVRPARLELRLRVTSRWDEAVELDVAWHLEADFADLLQGVAGDPGPGSEAEAEPGGVTFRCRWPGLPLETRVTAGAGAWRWDDDGRLRATVTLHRQEPLELVLLVDAVDGEDPLGLRRADGAPAAVVHLASSHALTAYYWVLLGPLLGKDFLLSHIVGVVLFVLFAAPLVRGLGVGTPPPPPARKAEDHTPLPRLLGLAALLIGALLAGLLTAWLFGAADLTIRYKLIPDQLWQVR